MSETKRHAAMRAPRRAFQTGATLLEFALVFGLFLTLVFGIIEIARIMYIYNTLQEVTRRAAAAAATSDFSNAATTNAIRQNAIFRTSPGELVLASPVSDQHVRIDYLALTRQPNGTTTMVEIAPSSLPSCPGKNRQICMGDPNASNCIRFVRVRVCNPANTDQCDRVDYSSFTQLVNLPVKLPTAPTIVPAESLGFTPGMGPCS
ncbi:MAG: pilus assembly protein TadE [Massilia sp.]|jgi:Flp pilus assembly protein TadG|nr:pilus assembly protein TadE [Massilia sp.]